MQTKDSIFNYFLPLWYVNACFCIANPFVFIIRRRGPLATVCRYLYDVIAISLSLIFVVFSLNDRSHDGGKALRNYFGIMVKTVYMLTAAVLVIANVYKSNQLLLVIKQLYTSEKKMELIGDCMSHKKNNQRLKGLLAVMGACWLVQCIFHGFTHPRPHRVSDIMTHIATYIPAAVTSLYATQFGAFGLAIEKLYLMINNLLLTTKASSECFMIVNLGKMEKLYTIQALQNDLYRITIKLNDCHSIPLLALCASQFMLLFGNIYWCISGYSINGKIIIPNSIKEYLFPIIPIVKSSVVLLTITVVSERIAKQQGETRKIIYDLIPSGNEEGIKQWVCMGYFAKVSCILLLQFAGNQVWTSVVTSEEILHRFWIF